MLVSAIAAVPLTAVTVVLPVPAAAQAEPCPPGQPAGRPPGTPPGIAPGQPPGRPPQYPPGKCQLRLSRSVVAAGGSLVVAGDGFAAGAPIRMAVAGGTLATVAASSTGSFSAEVRIPASTEPGIHEVAASGAAAGGGTQVLSASLTVTGSQPVSASLGDTLPTTGGGDGIGPLSAVGAGLVAVGSAAVAAARRRRQASAAAPE